MFHLSVSNTFIRRLHNVKWNLSKMRFQCIYARLRCYQRNVYTSRHSMCIKSTCSPRGVFVSSGVTLSTAAAFVVGALQDRFHKYVMPSLLGARTNFFSTSLEVLSVWKPPKLHNVRHCLATRTIETVPARTLCSHTHIK